MYIIFLNISISHFIFKIEVHASKLLFQNFSEKNNFIITLNFIIINVIYFKKLECPCFGLRYKSVWYFLWIWCLWSHISEIFLWNVMICLIHFCPKYIFYSKTVELFPVFRRKFSNVISGSQKAEKYFQVCQT